MRRSIAAAVLVYVVICGVSASGQDGGVATQPALFSPAAGSRLSPTVRELSIPGKTVTVGKFLPMLKEKLPSFQYVAKEGHWQDFVLPQLTLQNVTASQVIELLRYLVPQFEAELPAGGDSPSQVWVFRDRPVTPLFGGEVKLVAFGLNDPIDRLALRKSWSITANDAIAPTPEQIASSRKEALKEILSLLEATLAQASEPGAEPTLKLHEGTGVLLVKGSPGQINAISQALDALKSGDDQNQTRTQYMLLDSNYNTAIKKEKELGRRVAELENINQALTQGRLPTSPKNTDANEKH